MIIARNHIAVRAGEYDLRVLGIWRDPAALASPDIVPVGPVNPGPCRMTIAPYCRVVLLSTIHVIRKVIVERYTVELGRGLIFLRAPARAAACCYISAAVIRV